MVLGYIITVGVSPQQGLEAAGHITSTVKNREKQIRSLVLSLISPFSHSPGPSV